MICEILKKIVGKGNRNNGAPQKKFNGTFVDVIKIQIKQALDDEFSELLNDVYKTRGGNSLQFSIDAVGYDTAGIDRKYAVTIDIMGEEVNGTTVPNKLILQSDLYERKGEITGSIDTVIELGGQEGPKIMTTHICAGPLTIEQYAQAVYNKLRNSRKDVYGKKWYNGFDDILSIKESLQAKNNDYKTHEKVMNNVKNKSE